MKIVLSSGPNANAPLFLAQSQVALHHGETITNLIRHIRQVWCKGIPGIPEHVWEGVLIGRIPYTVHGQDVIIQTGD
jgi:hypothetical protein